MFPSKLREKGKASSLPKFKERLQSPQLRRLQGKNCWHQVCELQSKRRYSSLATFFTVRRISTWKLSYASSYILIPFTNFLQVNEVSAWRQMVERSLLLSGLRMMVDKSHIFDEPSMAQVIEGVLD